ncbi:MAG: prephenate dehydratase [Candidatus Omnitrophica bacterium]|nr:prephenate dehydratase [Candidatus Omnitrophota bacterium]
MSLERLRKKIDTIDNKILQLLNRRAKEVLKISKLKLQDKQSIFSAEREANIFRRLKKLNQGPLKENDVEIIFKEILSVSRSLNAVIDVAYLGPEGTFTHLAAIKKFGKWVNLIPCESIREVFERVEKEGVDYGVVPVENSTEGVVTYTLDMFLESSLKICAEIVLSISHSLLRVSLDKKLIRIYSNPQVFAQCREWLMREYPNSELVPTATTAKAAELAKKDPLSGCLGNKILASFYGLKEVSSHIEDSSSNATRFLVISKKDSLPSGDDKTSIIFSIKDRVGALHDVLYPFKRGGINLTKIESRPSKIKPWEYYFFVDFQGHRQELKVKKSLEALEKKCAFIKILGSYPKES